MKRIGISLITALVLASCATVDQPQGDAQTVRQRYTGEVGESAVGVIPDVLLRDNDRNRDLRITIEYPTRAGASPLILFSHGFGGSNRLYVALSSYWASQGYVVIKPTHADGERAIPLRSPGEEWESQTAADWRNRVRDLSFILDSLDRLEERYPELVGKIDRGTVGVGGHAYGAHTALLIGGAQTFPGGVSYADPRVKAIVAMSPQGPGVVRGLTSESYASIQLPAFFMTGTRDQGLREDETPEWRREAFALAPAGDKWLAVFQDASQASFTGRRDDLIAEAARREDTTMELPDMPGRREQPVRVTRATGQAQLVRERETFNSIKALSLAFWDTYLRGDAAGRELLERERGGVRLERK